MLIALLFVFLLLRFCCSIVRERFPQERGPPIAGHTLTLVPALRLENLLPTELHYRCATAPPGAAGGSVVGGVAGALPSGHTRPFHEVHMMLPSLRPAFKLLTIFISFDTAFETDVQYRN